MPPKISFNWPWFTVSVVGITGSAFFFWLAFDRLGQGTYPPPAAATIQRMTLPEPARPGLPIRLKIPKLKVDAPVELVGLTPHGAMDVPKDLADVAWFNLGPRPGQNGSAVMAGHYGWKNGIQTVFDRLHTLHPGDNVYVEDEKGATTGFAVREFRTYSRRAEAPDVFTSSDGQAHLNLITCEGVWNKIQNSYPNRLVVFTDKVTE